MNAVVYTDRREYGTDRPCHIGRIEEDDGCVTLAFRYTDDGSDWFPTWVGHVGEAVKVPRGWSLSDEMLTALDGARLDGADTP